MRNHTWVAGLLLLSAGCSDKTTAQEKATEAPRLLTLAERHEQLCRATITKDLLNPETVQFFEFTPLLEGDPGYHPSPFGELDAIDIQQYRFRYKAHSKVGLLVTAVNKCTVFKLRPGAPDGCICIDA